MDEGRTAPYGSRHVNRLGHLGGIAALLEAGLGVCVDAVGTLNGMGHRQGDEGLLTLRQFPVLEDSLVVIEKLPGQFRCFLADLGELAEVFGS